MSSFYFLNIGKIIENHEVFYNEIGTKRSAAHPVCPSSPSVPLFPLFYYFPQEPIHKLHYIYIYTAPLFDWHICI